MKINQPKVDTGHRFNPEREREMPEQITRIGLPRTYQSAMIAVRAVRNVLPVGFVRAEFPPHQRYKHAHPEGHMVDAHGTVVRIPNPSEQPPIPRSPAASRHVEKEFTYSTGETIRACSFSEGGQCQWGTLTPNGRMREHCEGGYIDDLPIVEESEDGQFVEVQELGIAALEAGADEDTEDSEIEEAA